MNTRVFHILILLAMVVPLQAVAQHSETEYVENHDGQGRLIVTARYERSFDANGSLIEEISAFQESTDVDFWLANRSTWTYDEQNRPVKNVLERNRKPAWEAYESIHWDYSEDHTVTIRIRQLIDGTGTPQNVERTTERFDDNGELLSRMNEYWIDEGWRPGRDPIRGVDNSRWLTVERNGLETVTTNLQWQFTEWVQTIRYVETAAHGDQPASTMIQIFLGGAWQNRSFRQEWTTSDGMTTRFESVSHNWIEGAWVRSSRLEMVTSNGKDERTGMVSDWEDDAWQPSSYFSRFERSDRRSIEIRYRMEAGGWLATAKEEWQRDLEGRIILRSMDVLSDGIWQPLNVQRWSFATATAVDTIELPAVTTFQVSPNPTSGRVTLHLENGVRVNPRLEVFDILGRSVTSTGTWDGGQVVDLDGLPAGVYLLRLRSEDRLETAKVIVK